MFQHSVDVPLLMAPMAFKYSLKKGHILNCFCQLGKVVRKTAMCFRCCAKVSCHMEKNRHVWKLYPPEGTINWPVNRLKRHLHAL